MVKIIAQNKKARYDYTILDEIEAGIILMGSEVKSIRDRKVSINDGHCLEIGGDIFLVNAHIAKYEGAILFTHQPRQNRKLLLHKKEISKIIGKIKTKGLALVPISMYFNHRNKIKIKIALVKGKKTYDKRETLKQKDQKRQEERDLAF